MSWILLGNWIVLGYHSWKAFGNWILVGYSIALGNWIVFDSSFVLGNWIVSQQLDNSWQLVCSQQQYSFFIYWTVCS